MQIRNDYTSFQNRNYQESRARYGTEYPHDGQEEKKEGGVKEAAADRTGKSGGDIGEEARGFAKDGVIYQPGEGAADMNASPDAAAGKKEGRSGFRLVKGFWDALGEEKAKDSKNPLIILKDNLLSGIHGAAASVKQTFQHRVIEKVQNIPVKIKEAGKGARAKFEKGKDAFTALTGGQAQEKDNSGASKKNREENTPPPGNEDGGSMRILKHSHLMDSYSRQGEYCQLNDNLTYSRIKNGKRQGKETTDKGGEEGET